MPDEEELFLAAIDIEDPDERSQFLRSACEGHPQTELAVRELLSFHDGNPAFLEEEVAAGFVLFQPGDVVDAYQITGVLGEGGFGIVYRARQEQPIQRDVALKVLKLGMDTASVVERFRQERQTLALLQHPNIARVIDAGATAAGRPYFVMEMVEGQPIDEFCDTQRLSVPERLDILLQVCEAVHHAHQKGIIHRDLKPTNILVGGEASAPKPQVKVIDFGVAKAVGTPSPGVTQQGQLLGTPDYMSPEQRQAAADVDIRSDVYALGALLCKLLTGTPPKFSSADQRPRLLQDSLILPSSRVNQYDEKRLQSIALKRGETSKTLPRVFSGELDWICQKALATAAEDRYPSVAMLSADLQAFLKNRPVVAGPPTWTYRAKKFVRRNQLASVLMGIVVLSVLIGGTFSSIGFLRANSEWRRAEGERRVAVAERDKSQATVKLMQRLLDFGNVQAGHRADFTVRQMLDEFSEMLDRDAGRIQPSQPMVESSLRHTLGKTYWSLGLMDRAGIQLQRAVELKQHTLGEQHLETARCEVDYAKFLASTSQLAEAESTVLRVMPILVSGAPSEELAWAYRVLAIAARERGDFDAAVTHSRKSLALSTQMFGDEHPTSVYLMIQLTPTLLEQKNLDEADFVSREALALATRLGEETYNAAAANRNRALVLEAQRDLVQATERIQTALRIDRRIVGESSGPVVMDLIALARLGRKSGRFRRAEKAARTACEYAEHLTIEPAIIRPQAYSELAEIIRDSEPAEAIRLWQQAIDEKTTSPGVHPSVGYFLVRQAHCYRQLGEDEQAEARYLRCIEVLETTSVEDLHREGTRMKRNAKPAAESVVYFPLVARFHLATLFYEQGRAEELETLAAESVLRGRGLGNPNCEQIVDLTEAAAYLVSGRLAKAQEMIDPVVDWQGVKQNDRTKFAWAQIFKADILVRQAEFVDAKTLLDQLQSFTHRKRFAAMRRQVERLRNRLPE